MAKGNFILNVLSPRRNLNKCSTDQINYYSDTHVLRPKLHIHYRVPPNKNTRPHQNYASDRHQAVEGFHHNSRWGLISVPLPNPKFTQFHTLTQRERKKSLLLLVRHPRQIQRKSSAIVSHPAFTDHPKRKRQASSRRETHSRGLALIPAVLPMIPPIRRAGGFLPRSC